MVQAGKSLGIASVPNLRDLGGYPTRDGRTVATGLAYRSDQLSDITPEDMAKLSALGRKVDYDLRTAAEQDKRPDELPPGVEYVWLNVLADDPQSDMAQLEQLLHDPPQANEVLGNGQVEAAFIEAYRKAVSLTSARTELGKLFRGLAERSQLPALFHCTTGKDRTGWAAAALLELLGVPRDLILADYLYSNDIIIPEYQGAIDAFVSAGGDPTIPAASFGVQPAYLDAAFEAMATQYGTIDNYFSEGLRIDADEQQALQEVYLGPS
jgi:protein-tyrosine phosphatase